MSMTTLLSRKYLWHWLQSHGCTEFDMDSLLVKLISAPHSLTKQLVKLSKKKFQVQVIAAGWTLASKTINDILQNTSHQKMWQRSVALCVDGVPFVIATTWIPLTTLAGPGRQLLFLKDRSLGNLLFRDPSLRRSEFIWSNIIAEKECLKQITRRSIFHFYGKPLLVSETFTSEALRALAEH